MVMGPMGLAPETDCAGEAPQQPYITNPPSRQRGRQILKYRECLIVISNDETGLRWWPDTRTDWPTDRRS
jgi:hypothetical protein